MTSRRATENEIGQKLIKFCSSFESEIIISLTSFREEKRIEQAKLNIYFCFFIKEYFLRSDRSIASSHQIIFLFSHPLKLKLIATINEIQ